jgi:F-type H+-transporting ATPase subunit epsilon
MSGLTLRVITPDKVALDTQAEKVRLPGLDGSLGILPRHAHMVAALDSGELDYTVGGKEHALFVAGGFAEVRDGTLRVVSPASERPEEIDETRVIEAEKRARERLDHVRKGEPIDILRAQAALRRALLRKLLKQQRG